MSWFPWFIWGVALVLGLNYWRKHRAHPVDRYVPAAAWYRAGLYFCFCYLFAWYSGALPAALQTPVATPEQMSDPIWRAWVFGLVTLVTIGYWVICVQGAFHPCTRGMAYA